MYTTIILNVVPYYYIFVNYSQFMLMLLQRRSGFPPWQTRSQPSRRRWRAPPTMPKRPSSRYWSVSPSGLTGRSENATWPWQTIATSRPGTACSKRSLPRREASFASFFARTIMAVELSSALKKRGTTVQVKEARQLLPSAEGLSTSAWPRGTEAALTTVATRRHQLRREMAEPVFQRSS